MDPNALPVTTDESKEQKTEASELVVTPFDINIDESELVDAIDKRIDEALKYYKNDLKLDSRRQTMEDFWIGKQLDETKLYDFQVPYKDNIIWQDLETRISIAAGRMPDIIVTPANQDDESRQTAKKLEQCLDLKIRNDSTRRMVKHGLRDMSLYLQGALKCRWDRNKGENGDFVFERVRPQRLIVDHTATIPEDGFTADNMEMIAEVLEEPVSLVLAKFPAKKDALFQKLGIIRGTVKQMSTKIKYHEVWFTWYDEKGDIYEGVCWKYKKLLLGKMKNPYYDWDGYDVPYDQPQVDPNTGQQVYFEKYYRNQFDRPRKPYIFFTHQNLGRGPIDDTSPVEQAIPLQKVVNKRGRQITEIADRAIPKIAFAGKWITREQVRRITNDPDEHIWIENADNVTNTLLPIPAQQPSPILYNDMVGNRLQIDSKFATHGTTRGELQAQESGISKQITREGDLTISDDLVAITVERVTYEMANWATQMMKVLYDKVHFIKDLGKDGEVLSVEMSQDKIEDGTLVNVKASSTDKDQRRADAVALAQQKAIDPLSLAEDLDLPNPKERTKRLIAFLSGDMKAYAKTIGIELPETQPADQGAQQAAVDIQSMQSGQPVEPPQEITPEYVQAIEAFINSPDFASLAPEVQQIFQDYVGKLDLAVNQPQPPPGGEVPATPEEVPTA